MTSPQNDELRAAQEARKKRRAEFVELIRKAGVNPAMIDVTKVMSDEEQAELMRQRAAAAEAKELAQKLGRTGLREQLKQTIKSNVACVDRVTQKLSPEKLADDSSSAS